MRRWDEHSELIAGKVLWVILSNADNNCEIQSCSKMKIRFWKGRGEEIKKHQNNFTKTQTENKTLTRQIGNCYFG